MPEATIDENGVIECGRWTLMNDDLIYAKPEVGYAAIMHTSESELDDLYAVLHARHMAQAYDKTYLTKVEQAAKSLKDDDLYKSDGAY